MGQYHNVINIDAKAYYSPADLADGLKLMEQGCSFPSTTALALLLADKWNGQRVFLLGDYAEEGDVNGVESVTELVRGLGKYAYAAKLARTVVEENTSATFGEAFYGGDNDDMYSYRTLVTPDNMEFSYDSGRGVATGSAFDGIDNTEVVAFVNYDKREKYIGNARTMREVIQHFDKDFMTRVFVLLAGSIRGGARGGGDAHHDMGGAWAGDRVGIVPAGEVEDFTEIQVQGFLR